MNSKLAKQNFLKKGLISPEEFQKILEAVPNTTKYVYWMCKQYSDKKQNIELSHLFNIITEFDTLCRSGRFGIMMPDVMSLNVNDKHLQRIVKRRIEKGGTRDEQLAKIFENLDIENAPSDINSYKTFKDLEIAVEEINHKVQEFEIEDEKKNDYWISIDNENLLLVDPKTPEASSFLGKKYFIFPESRKYPDKCPWCVAYAEHGHFKRYYKGSSLTTFYYVKAKGEFKKELIKENLLNCIGIAVEISYKGNINFWDINDSSLSSIESSKYQKIMNKYLTEAERRNEWHDEPNKKVNRN